MYHEQPQLLMTSPESSGGKNDRSVGVALIAIVVGTSFVFSYAASDGKLLSQFFNSDKEEPDSAVAETPESAAPPESMRERQPGDDQGTESSGNSQTLSDEDRQRLMQAKNFPWSLASDEYLESLATQDALDGFKQKEPSLQSDQSAGLTTGLSILSDKAAADIDIFVLDDLNEHEDDDSEQLDLMFEDDAPNDRAESEPTAGDEGPEQPSPPAEQDIDEPDNSTVPDDGNDTDDQPVEDEPEDTEGNDTGTSDDSGSNSTGTSETSNSTSDE
jgi:hypothetical protein